MSEPRGTPSGGQARRPSARSARLQPSAKGPLETQHDPLASSPSPLEADNSGAQSQLPVRPGAASIASHDDPGSRVSYAGVAANSKEFAFLLRPEIYHPLTPLNVPAAFRDSPKNPDSTASLDQLLARGHFRAAAIASVQQLTGSGPGGAVEAWDAPRIFSLLYTRLACLTLIGATSLAAQEVKALGDLNNSQLYVDDSTGEHLVPWELRLLNVRLQALGFGDPRGAVMSYYELAREARDHIRRANRLHDEAARDVWKARLHRLGLKVAGALIDLGDLTGAGHHLASLEDSADSKVAFAKALLWLHLGDADEARSCAAAGGFAAERETIITALCDMADAEYEAALDKWRQISHLIQQDEMVGVNTAVCLLYLGRMQEGREMLEAMVGSQWSSHTLLFNLSTMYELCTEKSRDLKLKLAARVAEMDESPAGWEKTNGDFKL